MAKPEGYEFVSENPHLIIPVGVLGSMPLSFPKHVASQYNAAHFSALQALDYVLDCAESQGVKPKMREAWDEVEGVMYRCAEDALEEGSNVVLDGFYNTPESRSEMLWLAQKYGAVTIALTMTTTHQQSRDRVAVWTELNMLGASTDRWPDGPDEVVLAMMHKLKNTTQEGFDHAFLIDGSKKASKVYDSFNWLMRYHGITYPVRR